MQKHLEKNYQEEPSPPNLPNNNTNNNNNLSSFSLPKISQTPPSNENLSHNNSYNNLRESLPEIGRKSNKFNKSHKKDKCHKSLSTSIDHSAIETGKPDKKFDDLVQFILKSKDFEDKGRDTVDAVLDKWKKFSKF